jgi:hypothetical protein
MFIVKSCAGTALNVHRFKKYDMGIILVVSGAEKALV